MEVFTFVRSSSKIGAAVAAILHAVIASPALAQTPLALNAPTSDRIMVMPADSPFNPYGSRFYDPAGAPNADGSPRLTGTPTAIGFTQMTIHDLAAETVKTEADAMRFVAGLRGVLGNERSWEWEASQQRAVRRRRRQVAQHDERALG